MALSAVHMQTYIAFSVSPCQADFVMPRSMHGVKRHPFDVSQGKRLRAFKQRISAVGM